MARVGKDQRWKNQRSHKRLFGSLATIILTLSSVMADNSCYVLAAESLVTGAFIQLDSSLASQSASWWQAEIEAMADIGMDSVIVQYVALDNTYFYPTTIPGFMPFATDSLERILTAADENSMRVYLGVQLDTDQYSSGGFNLNANLQQGQATLQELATRYGSHSSLSGWYGPQEISDFIALDGSQTQLRNNLTSYVHDMAALGRSPAGLGLETMISPYFGQNPNAQAYAQWWDNTGLPAMGVDILALQDGVGTHRTTISQSREVFQSFAPVMSSHGVEFWGNNEAFDQIHGPPVDGQPFQAVPTDIATFIDQIESSSPLVTKSITFEFSHYLSPQRNSATQSLYGDYRSYFRQVMFNQIPVAGYTYANSPTAAFHPSATDFALNLLTDGNSGSLQNGPGSAFSNGTWVGFGDDAPNGGPQPGIVLDLGGQHAIDEVEITYLVDASSFIFSPQEVNGLADALSVSVSTDGTTFTTQASSNNFTEWSTDFSNGVFEVRTATLDLGGVDATHLSIDVRTPNTWIFLGEVSVFEAISAADFNADGVVDGADLSLWQSRYGIHGTCGDADGDGDVDGRDFLIWQRQTSLTADTVLSVSLPEPNLGFFFVPLATLFMLFEKIVRRNDARSDSLSVCNRFSRTRLPVEE